MLHSTVSCRNFVTSVTSTELTPVCNTMSVRDYGSWLVLQLCVNSKFARHVPRVLTFGSLPSDA